MESDVARAGSHIIKRPRLIRLLDQANSRIILLLAPAGYGKTTLARQWLEHGNRPVAWYVGTPASSDVAALAAGLSRAVRSIVSEAGERVVDRIRVSQNPQLEPRLLAEMFAEDLAGWPEDAWLCVDDYHFLMEAKAAEEFFEAALRSHIRLLITSRERPSWATARLVVYGEMKEFDRHALALTRPEARKLLARSNRRDVSSVLETADGWPAVLGLAALAGGDRPAPDVPGELYDYFAQELFSRVDDELQRHLLEMALVPEVHGAVANRLFGVLADRILADSARSGFLTSRGADAWSLHPLLRRFLLRRFAEQTPAFRREVLADVGEALIREARWDEVFGLVQTHGISELYVELLESSFTEMLDNGRLATLGTWMEFARAKRVDSPIVDLIEAELRLREANYRQSEALATRAGRRLPRGSSLLWRAWLTAGRAAHLGNRPSALVHLERAARYAADEEELDEALWVRLVASGERDHAEAETVLEHLRRVESDRPEHELRLAMGTGSLAEHAGDLRGAVEAYLAARALVRRVRDPMTRSVYLNRTGYLLNLVGRYDEAAEVCEECRAEAKADRLDFAFLHVSTTLAMALLGLRHLGRTRNMLAEVIAGSERIGDTYVALNARALMARLQLAQSRASLAVETTGETPDVSHRPLRGEYLATRALALVVCGSIDEGLSVARSALAETSVIETRLLVAWARAIAALGRTDQEASHVISEALDETIESGYADGLVCAYRAFPPLLEAIARLEQHRAALASIIQRAKDGVLARQAGLAVRHQPIPLSGLTPREQEVHSLLSEGLTNREIAERLFISETTAKVHVRRILEKLGVRSRTEAVLLPEGRRGAD